MRLNCVNWKWVLLKCFVPARNSLHREIRINAAFNGTNTYYFRALTVELTKISRINSMLSNHICFCSLPESSTVRKILSVFCNTNTHAHTFSACVGSDLCRLQQGTSTNHQKDLQSRDALSASTGCTARKLLVMTSADSDVNNGWSRVLAAVPANLVLGDTGDWTCLFDASDVWWVLIFNFDIPW